MRRSLTMTVLGALLLLAGCGGPTQTTAGGPPAQPMSPGSSSAPEQPRHSGPPKCVAADMTGVFGPGDTIHPGTHQLSIVATNTSDHTCTVYGYGGLELHAGGGGAVPVNLTREPAPGPESITLEPGDKAYKKLLWAYARNNQGATTCVQGAVSASVTMPDDTETFDVRRADALTICGDLKGYAWSATDRSKEG